MDNANLHSIADANATLKECVFRNIPPGSTAHITAVSSDSTVFGSVEIEEETGRLPPQPLVLGKTLSIPLLAGRIYVVRVTMAFTGEAAATVEVTSMVTRPSGAPFGLPCVNVFTGTKGDVARQLSRFSVKAS